MFQQCTPWLQHRSDWKRFTRYYGLKIIYQINNRYMEHAQIGAVVITQLQSEYGI